MSLFTNKRIMVVAAHPDDELLGLGATMHKLVKAQGVQTYPVRLTVRAFPEPGPYLIT